MIWFGTNLERHHIKFWKGLKFGWVATIYSAHSTSSMGNFWSGSGILPWFYFFTTCHSYVHSTGSYTIFSNNFLSQPNKVYCIDFYVHEICLMSQTLCYKLSLPTTLAPYLKRDMVFKPVDSFHKENENCLRISFIWRICFSNFILWNS